MRHNVLLVGRQEHLATLRADDDDARIEEGIVREERRRCHALREPDAPEPLEAEHAREDEAKVVLGLGGEIIRNCPREGSNTRLARHVLCCQGVSNTHSGNKGLRSWRGLQKNSAPKRKSAEKPTKVGKTTYFIASATVTYVSLGSANKQATLASMPMVLRMQLFLERAGILAMCFLSVPARRIRVTSASAPHAMVTLATDSIGSGSGSGSGMEDAAPIERVHSCLACAG